MDLVHVSSSHCRAYKRILNNKTVPILMSIWGLFYAISIFINSPSYILNGVTKPITIKDRQSEN
jgi:hypothetical protein